jgi:hypothetical protein
MEIKPFNIKVEAVIIRANGDREELGAIGFNTLKDKNEYSIDIGNKK